MRGPPLDERRATLLALAAVALWSTVATGFKLGLAALAPVQLLLAGSVVSLLLFAALTTLRRGWPALLARPLASHAQDVVLGLLNPCVYYLVLFEAYSRLPAHVAQPLNYTWAITLALLSVPLLKQRLSLRALGGILVSYAGVAVLLGAGSQSEQALDCAGVALALGSTLIWATYWLLNARSRSPALATMTASFFWGTLAVLAVCLATSELPILDSHTAFYGAWVGLVEMGVTFLLWQAALVRTAHAGRIGQLIFLSPFVSFGLIALVLGEQLHVTAVLALALIVAGVVVTQRAA